MLFVHGRVRPTRLRPRHHVPQPAHLLRTMHAPTTQELAQQTPRMSSLPPPHQQESSHQK